MKSNLKIRGRQKKVVLLGFLLLSISLFWGCKNRQSSGNIINNQSKAVNEKETANYDAQFTGVLKEHNEEMKSITVYDIENQRDVVFDYTSATGVKNLYGQELVMPQIPLGEIVDVYYYAMSQKLTEVRISEEAWVYNGVGNLKTDKSNYRMTISGQNYWYDDGLMLFSEEQPIELMDLSTKDILTVKGVGSRICSVIVTTGHGYIRLKNYADFIGGTIEVGYGIIVPIVEDMLIVAKEGSYKVVLQNGELVGTENISLKRNEEIVVDMSAYRMEKERIGYVRFELDPYGADLYINEMMVDYSDPIKMNYGRHKIRVVMTGYDEFNGILTIGETTTTICISLAERTAEVVDVQTGEGNGEDEVNTSIEEIPGEDRTEEVVDGTVGIDKEHTITVESPAGATLYLNGRNMGTIPLSITKEIGDHVILLSQSGYLTKSYSVEVIDDGENVVLNFPEMILSEP